MRSTNRIASLLLLLVPAAAAAAPRVVTTTEGLAALVREVGGDRVSVESLSRGVQDPHFVDANPVLAVKLRRADLLVDVGLDLESGWLPALVTQSRNAKIGLGERGRVVAGTHVSVLDAPAGPVDRSGGDLHPAGNPHFLTDPRRAVQVASVIADRLGQLDPPNAAYYGARLGDFRSRIEAALARWQAALAPAKGRAILTRHRTMSYFLEWTGLRTAGELEPQPGVPPPPAHLASLVGVAKREGVKAIVVENYYDTASADVVSRHSGARVVRIPGDVGGERDVKTYEGWMDVLVRRIGEAVR